MERALAALTRGALYFVPDQGWTLGEGREFFASHTIIYLARHRGYVTINGDEATLSAAGRALHPEWAA